MLNVVMLSAIMLCVVVSFLEHSSKEEKYQKYLEILENCEDFDKK